MANAHVPIVNEMFYDEPFDYDPKYDRDSF